MISFLKKTFRKFSRQQVNQLEISAIETIIKYNFSNTRLLETAFKHRSYLAISGEEPWFSNERLEFLGDAVLELLVTEYFYHRFPESLEGELSKVKSVLVSRSVLAQLAAELGLGGHLQMNRGEEKTGGKKRTSNLANVYESLVGAIYLDGGLKMARKFVCRTLLDSYENLVSDRNHINYKSILLEYAQGKGWGNPNYRLVQESGPDHDKVFIMNVSLNNKGSAEGDGKSKKIAEQNCAHNLLKHIAPELLNNNIKESIPPQ